MEIDYHNSKLKEADEMEANAIWDVVESTIVSSNYIAEHSAIHAANNITKDINAKYDVKILKQQLDGSALEESEVVSLLYENIKECDIFYKTKGSKKERKKRTIHHFRRQNH